MTEETKSGGVVQELVTLLKSNIRDYMMYIALVVIMGIFTVLTNGGFIQARNIANLFNQAGYVAILAIGMTLVLIISHIDLSVGYVAGFSGAVAAILMTKLGLSEWIAIPLVLGLGFLIGLYQGTLVTRVGVPAFVATLAGMFIFRGLLNLTLQETGTIIIPNVGFNALSNGFIPDLPVGSALHILTLVIGALLVAAMIYSQVSVRKNNMKYGFKVMSTPLFTAKLILFSVVIMVVFFVLAEYQGLPWSAVIVGVVLFIFNYVLNETKFGRYIYGIGGNSQAAELSGIDVKKITHIVFCIMSTMAALAGILYTSRLQSATPTAGNAFEMDAIASSYIGGVAVSGGVGRVTNTIVGALVITSLTNGMNLLGVDISYQYVVKGLIFIIAVAFDVRTRKN